jgi:hypothetical protein
LKPTQVKVIGRHCLKNKRDEDVTQVVEYLLSMYKTFGLLIKTKKKMDEENIKENLKYAQKYSHTSKKEEN